MEQEPEDYRDKYVLERLIKEEQEESDPSIVEDNTETDEEKYLALDRPQLNFPYAIGYRRHKVPTGHFDKISKYQQQFINFNQKNLKNLKTALTNIAISNMTQPAITFIFAYVSFRNTYLLTQTLQIKLNTPVSPAVTKNDCLLTSMVRTASSGFVGIMMSSSSCAPPGGGTSVPIT